MSWRWSWNPLVSWMPLSISSMGACRYTTLFLGFQAKCFFKSVSKLIPKKCIQQRIGRTVKVHYDLGVWHHQPQNVGSAKVQIKYKKNTVILVKYIWYKLEDNEYALYRILCHCNIFVQNQSSEKTISN